MKKVSIIIGARPNFMKAFPVYEALKEDFELTLIHTGQHFNAKMSDVFFNQLKFPKPDIHLTLEKKTKSGDFDDKLYVNNTDYLKDKDAVIEELMSYDGDLGQLGEIRDKLKIEFEKGKPDLVIVFGDVTSTLSAGLAAKMLNIELAHVESGLRSGDLKMPEEVNRVLTDHITKYYFVTEQSGIDNFKEIGITENVYLVGNTMIDTQKKYLQQALDTKYHETLGVKSKEYVLITLHRPSNVDDLNKLKEIFDDFENLSKKETLVYPIHPRTKNNLEKLGYLKKVEENPNIILDEPLGYLEFTCLMANCKYLVTDSGGLQEESTSLDIPCFTLRENTERPSTFIENHGTNQLISKISKISEMGLRDCNTKNILFGSDTRASQRISYILNNLSFTNTIKFKFSIKHIYVNNNSNKLLILFQGATNKIKFPYFQMSRITWQNINKNYNYLYILDNTIEKTFNLYENYKIYDKDNIMEVQNKYCIGWNLYDILNKNNIVELINYYKNTYSFNKLYFFGSSGGGFQSLYYGSYFKNSNIICENAQYTPELYYNQRFNQICNILEFYNIKYDNNKILKYIERIFNNNCRLLVIQNITDEFHFKQHFKLLKNKFNNYKYYSEILTNKKGGHGAASSQEEIFDILQKL